MVWRGDRKGFTWAWEVCGMSLEWFSGGKPCSNWLTEVSGGTTRLHRVLMHNQVKTSETGVFVFKWVNGWPQRSICVDVYIRRIEQRSDLFCFIYKVKKLAGFGMGDVSGRVI